jgi:hypothetical protein
LTPISGYDVTNIGTPDIVPDIDPDIRFEVYDIGYMLTRYRAAVSEPHIRIVNMHPYRCNVNVVKLSYMNHQHHNLAWHLTGLDG